MTGSPGSTVFTTLTPDATLVMLHTANLDFADKIQKAAMGGAMDTAAKNESRQNLLGFLRKLAGYVQITASKGMQLDFTLGLRRQSIFSATRTPVPARESQTWLRRFNSAFVSRSLQSATRVASIEAMQRTLNPRSTVRIRGNPPIQVKS